VSTGTAGTSARGTSRTARSALPTRTTGRRTTRTAGATGSTAKVSAGTARPVLGRHRHIVINLCCGYNNPTLLSVAGFDNLPVFSALECSFQIVEAEIRFGPFLAMTPGARLFQHRLNVLGVGETGGFGSGRHFSQVQLVQIGLAIGQGGDGGGGEAGYEQATCFYHNADYCCEYQSLIRNSNSNSCVIAGKLWSGTLRED
jgi:hypothetical protein